MAKKRLIPFKFMPGSWGLKGKTYERAKAEYELEGYELEVKLSELEFGDDTKKLAQQRAIIDFEHGKITDYEREKKIAELIDDETEKKKKLLEVEYTFHKITENEYEKQKATLNKEPWVKVIKITLDKNNPSVAGEWELDWNEHFVEDLKKNGYNGAADYIIVENWFNMLCSAIAAENGIIDSTNKLPPENPDDLEDGKRAYY